MNPEVALRPCLALFALWIAVYYLWRDFRNDAFRDDIFSIRDRMFLYAAKGNISFDHPAYTILRNRMNGILRHGHEFTLTRMTLILTTHTPEKPEVVTRWESAIEGLSEEVRNKMKEFNVSVALFVLLHVTFCSFFRYMTIRPLMFFFRIRKLIETPKVVSSVERLESESLEQESRHLGHGVAA